MSREHAAILLIEDNPGDARLIREMLPEGRGVVRCLEWVESLEAGLRRIVQGGIDLVLLDLGLPESTGLETLRHLRDKAAQVPAVVVMSSLGDEAVAVQAVLEGAQDYLVKGEVDARLLTRSIRYAIDRNETTAALRRAHDDLENQVRERTATLADAVEALEREIAERELAQERLRRLNRELDQRVRERTAQLEAAVKEIEDFAYSVSHDLRAPLRSIDGFSHALLEEYADKLDDEGKEHLRTVRAASQRMGHLIDDVLRLLQLNRVDMHRGEVNLSRMVEQAADTLSSREPGRRVEFVIAPDCVVCGDVALLRVAIEHILDNAWKYTSRTPNAKIEFGATDTAEGPAYFVRDNGCGFDMRYAHKLFGAFQRLHWPSEFSGSGVGLAAVQRVLQRHGGRVWIEGKVDEGATLYFTVPERQPPS